MTLVQDTVKQAHPDTAVDGVPDEVLYTLYFELFKYGRATAVFKEDIADIFSVFIPYRGTPTQKQASKKLQKLQDYCMGILLEHAERVENTEGGLLAAPDIVSALYQDYLELSSPEMFLGREYNLRTSSKSEAVVFEAGMILSENLLIILLPTLLISRNDQTATRDGKMLHELCTSFLSDYEAWKNLYVTTSTSGGA